jgi:hypothetical protein
MQKVIVVNNYWKPKEIIIHETVKDDPITNYHIQQCAGVPVKYVPSGEAEVIKKASDILSQAGPSIREQIMAGKQVIYLSPGKGAVDTFSIPDDRLVCPHFHRLKLASKAAVFLQTYQQGFQTMS